MATDRCAPKGVASMEPQLEGCGKRQEEQAHLLLLQLQWSRNLRVAESEPCGSIPPVSALLQWSRNLRVAESLFAGNRPVRVLEASMEPQLEGCGKGARLPNGGSTYDASMEPQLEGCGKLSRIRQSVYFQNRFNGAAT